MRLRGDMELHPFSVAFGDLAVTFGAYLIAARFIETDGFREALQGALPWMGLVTVFLLHTLHLEVVQGRNPRDALRSVLITCLLIGLVLNTALLLIMRLPFTPTTLLGPVAIQSAAILGWRLLCIYVGTVMRGHRRLVIIGTQAEYQRISAKIGSASRRGYEQVAYYATVSEALQDSLFANSMLLAPSVPHEAKKQMLSICLVSGRECLIVPDSYEISLGQAEVRQIHDLPVLTVHPIGLGRVEQVVKRSADLVFSLAGITLLAPIWLLIWIAVRLSSPGPLFYVQERIGRGGRPFTCFKFRTMVDGAENETGPVLAAVNDARVTAIGQILRAIRLDETPQLLNILRGEMSLVGPRPERPYFIEQITRELPEYKYRLLVQPGLTGLAQVEAGYHSRPEDKLRYDLLYVQNYSLLLDIKIILATLRVVLFPGSKSGKNQKDPDALEVGVSRQGRGE